MSPRPVGPRPRGAPLRSLLGGWFLLVLFLQAACATGSPLRSRLEPRAERGLESATVYELGFVEPGAMATRPVPMARAEFQQAFVRLSRDIRLGHSSPREAAREWLQLVQPPPHDVETVESTGDWELEVYGGQGYTLVPERQPGPVRLSSWDNVEHGAAWAPHGWRVLPDAHLLKGVAMAWLENVVFKNQELENERLELTDKGSLYYLSTDLTLRRCTVVLKVPASRLILKGVRFIDCTLEVKQELKNHQDWISASLKGCRFRGRFWGCDFGHWPEYGSDPWYQHGSIEDCDFTEARLDGCRFMGCDPATIRFPKWPCFTILDPIGRSRELNSVPWPGRVGSIAIETLSEQPARTTALTEHAPSLAKRYDTTPEALRAVIERFDCIVY